LGQYQQPVLKSQPWYFEFFVGASRVNSFTANQNAERSGVCPSGFSLLGGKTDLCYRQLPPISPKNFGCCSVSPQPFPILIGDPVNVTVGNQTETEVDFVGSGAFPLRFERTYNSLYAPSVTGLNGYWKTNFDRAILQAESSSTYRAHRPDGRAFVFTMSGNVGAPDADVSDRLLRLTDAGGNTTGWKYTTGDDTVELYDAAGVLRSMTNRAGQTQTLTYSTSSTPPTIAPNPGLLIQVTDPNGRSLSFSYDPLNRVSTMTDPAGQVTSYTYTFGSNPELVSRTAPSSATRTYVYNETAYTSGASQPHALTGIVDENSQRYATFGYDSSGRAISTQHAGGVNLTSIVYNFGTSVTATDALGKATTYNLATLYNVVKPTSVTQSCSGCTSVSGSTSYDTAGYLQSKTDFNGQITKYTYDDTRGLETQRIEAYGTASARTINTAWNANFRVPDSRNVVNASSVTESLTKWAYNTRGQVLSRCEIDPAVSGASSYTCGSLSSAPLGVRQTSYAYCEQAGVTAGTCPLVGLVLSVDGARIDVSDVTTYTYYQTTDVSGCATLGGTCHYLGDLYRVTNALGQVTTYVSYDKNGRVTRMQDANGTLTDMTYHPRGWLLTRTVRANADGSASANDATTTFAYDNVGQVTKITQPDGAYLAYTYDAAHRLTDITDNAGNTIHYTLDAAGNRTKEDTKDPTSTLMRTLSRQYDQLNHLTKTLNAASDAVQTWQSPAEAAPSGITYTNGYDGNGNAIYSVDGNGVGGEQQYDPLNRLVKTLQDHAGTGATKDTTTQYAYDARDNLRSVNDPDGLVTGYTYDGLNNLIQLQSPDTGTSGYTYDAAGNRATQTDARGVTAMYSYDALNRLTAIAYPTTSLNIAYGYDEPNSTTGCTASYPLGRLTTITDSSGSTRYCYDRRGNITTKIQVAKGGSAGVPGTAINWALASNGGVASASSTYTPAPGYPVTGINDGDRTGRTWGNGGGWNDNTAQTFPDWVEIDFKSPQSISSVNVVTLQNNFATGIDPLSTTTFTLYGVTAFHVQVLSGGNWVTVGTVTGNNLVKRTVTFAPTVASAIRVYCDDSADHYWSRLVEVETLSSDITQVTQTAYTVADRIAAITYPSGASASYTRDAMGRVTAVSYKANPTATAVTLVSGITYYPFGPLRALTYGNGRSITKSYDQDYAIHAVASSDPIGTQLGPIVDVLGNMIANSPGTGISPPTHTYSYDPLYRLTKVADASANTLATYGYNKTGDRLSTSSAGQSSTYTYVAGTHRLSTTGGPARSYDNNGNLQTSTATGGYPANQWTYDDRNRMATAQSTASGGATTSAVYNYNGKGERVVKAVTGGSVQNTVFVYNEGGQLLGEYAAGSGSAQGEYIYIDGVPLGYAAGGQLYYVETDHLGTVRRIIQPGATTSSDTIVWRWGSFGDAAGHVNMFGEFPLAVQTVGVNLRFPGQYYDAETGSHYNYFRDYEPGTGRYLEGDPAGQVGGVNVFNFCKSSPLNCIDLFGLDNGSYSSDTRSVDFWKKFQEDVCRIFPDHCSGKEVGDGTTYKQRCTVKCIYNIFFDSDKMFENGLDSAAGYLKTGCKELARFYVKRVFFIKDVVGFGSCIQCCGEKKCGDE
jgi:RHS repeat-associated protein